VHFAARHHFTLLDVLNTKNEEPNARAAVARALGAMCAEPELDALTEFAKAAGAKAAFASDVILGIAAIEALGRIHPPDLRLRLASLQTQAAKGALHIAVQDALLPSAGHCAAVLKH
jgi:hypothetical protein